MKHFISISLLSLQCFFLFCITGMGLLNAAPLEFFELKTPCHQEKGYSEETQVQVCNQCEASLLLLSQEIVRNEELVLLNPTKKFVTIEATFDDTIFNKIPQKKLCFYRPPPEVVWINAMYQPKKKVVLII